jgi:hypothetical protein
MPPLLEAGGFNHPGVVIQLDEKPLESNKIFLTGASPSDVTEVTLSAPKHSVSLEPGQKARLRFLSIRTEARQKKNLLTHGHKHPQGILVAFAPGCAMLAFFLSPHLSKLGIALRDVLFSFRR